MVAHILTVSPGATAAFHAWTLAQLAARYAEPCSDKVMGHLVAECDRRYHALATTPALTHADVLVKVFPLLLDMFEPQSDASPLVPHCVSASKVHFEAFTAIMADIRRLVQPIAVVLETTERGHAT